MRVYGNAPLLKVMSLLLKSIVGSDEMNFNSMDGLFVIEPLVTFDDDMSMVGRTLSNVNVNMFDAVLRFPAESMKAPSGTKIVFTPWTGAIVAL